MVDETVFQLVVYSVVWMAVQRAGLLVSSKAESRVAVMAALTVVSMAYSKADSMAE